MAPVELSESVNEQRQAAAAAAATQHYITALPPDQRQCPASHMQAPSAQCKLTQIWRPVPHSCASAQLSHLLSFCHFPPQLTEN